MIQCPCTMRSGLTWLALTVCAISVIALDQDREGTLSAGQQSAATQGEVNKLAGELPKTDETVIKIEENSNTANLEEAKKPEEIKNEEAKRPEEIKNEEAKKPEEIKNEEAKKPEDIRNEPEAALAEVPNEEKPVEKPVEDVKVQPEDEKVKYNGVKVVRVVVANKEQKKYIRELENKGDISTWLGNGTAVDVLIRRETVVDDLKSKQLSFDVVIDDLQKAIDEENPQLSEEEWNELEGRKGHRLTWQLYHRMTDIHSYLDYLTAAYPQNCSKQTIGHSVEGRPLQVLKISSGQPNSPAIWVDSGIHAREWITPASSTYAISQMVENGDGPHGVDWYFLPLVNPDGYEHSHKSDRLWRKNRANAQKGSCAGTDLNRNFGYRWGGQGASKQPCRETYAGTGPFSEPETAAINSFILNKSGQIKAYVSLHSYGQYILYPWGYDRKVPPDYSDLDRVGRAMALAMKKTGGQTYTVGAAASTLYPASGGSDDWAKGTAKIKYAYTIELRDTGRHGFVLPAQYIVPTAKEAYAALTVLAQEVRDKKK